MANPQKENGHIRIATELWEALYKIRISGEARQVLDFIIRKTWGWGKAEDAIALSQFSVSVGIPKRSVCRALEKLTLMNLIHKKDTPNTTIYRFNKDFETWKPFTKKTLGVSKKTTGGVQKAYRRGVQKAEHNNYYIATSSIDKRIRSSFDDHFWSVYPRKVAKKRAFRSWKSLKPSEEVVARIVADIDRRLSSREWDKTEMQYIPHPSTYINERRWEDETETKHDPYAFLREKDGH